MIRATLAALLLTATAAATPALAAGRPTTGSATAYHTCDGSGPRTALGTRVRWGIVANNSLPLGTWIETLRPALVGGRRYFRVEDRGGPGFALDFAAPSCRWMNWWGRRTVTYRALSRADLHRGLPRGGWQPAAPGRPARWNAAGARPRAHAADR